MLTVIVQEIQKEIYNDLLRSEESQKLIVDLAVPRNIDQNVIDHFNVNYIDIEQLRSLAEKNLEFRKSEVVQAKDILETNLDVFRQAYLQRQLELALQDIPTDIKSIKEKAVNQVFKNKVKN